MSIINNMNIKKFNLLFYFFIANIILFFVILTINNYISYKLRLNSINLEIINSKVKNRFRLNFQKQDNIDINTILKRNPFKVIESINDNNKNIESQIKEIPIADIKDFELRGIIWSEEKKDRIAIIYDKKLQLEGIYSIGDKLSGATIKDIMKDQIIVNINNKDKRILFSDFTKFENGMNFSKELNFIVSKHILKSKLSNMPSLLRSMRIVPYSASGIKGFKVVSIRDKFIKNRLGLKKGDIILSINGKQVTNMDNIMQLYSKVQDIDHVDLEILRNGQRQVLSYSIK
ncbi:type II secretion system protein N [Desulfothermus sp.]